MNAYSTGLTYRKTAAVGASGVELAIALFDTLAGDMTRAIAAMRKDDIQGRCDAMSHALQVLGCLEQWIDFDRDGEFARNLATFYTHLRCKLLEAQSKVSTEILEEEIGLVLTIRRSWQEQLDSQFATASTSSPGRAPQGLGAWGEERGGLSWSA